MSHPDQANTLSEQALAWSGLPVVTIRPTMFLESFLQLAAPSVRNRDRIELPFGRGKTSPVAAADVAQVVAAVLADPVPHLGLIYELTGPQSQDLDGVAREFSDALNREVTYSDISPEEWEQKLKRQGMPEHLTGHLLAMGELHRAGRYDRRADGVQRVTGRPAMSVREFVSLHAGKFGGRRSRKAHRATRLARFEKAVPPVDSIGNVTRKWRTCFGADEGWEAWLPRG